MRRKRSIGCDCPGRFSDNSQARAAATDVPLRLAERGLTAADCRSDTRTVDTQERLAAAVKNILHWYDALCMAHGVPGEYQPAYWINRGTMHPYMSNFVTLRDGAHASLSACA